MGSISAFKSLGVKVKDKEQPIDDKYAEVDKPIFSVKNGYKDTAVQLGLIPEAYKDAEFDEELVKENLINQYKNTVRKVKVIRFKDYVETIKSILSSLRSGVRLDKSYLIGAPNGFGKMSFVATAIKIMHSRGWKAVPYVPLSELAEMLATIDKKFIARKFGREIISETTNDYNMIKYTWNDYMNADVLFCFFSSIDSKVTESYTLKSIVDIRSSKGLPTIALISTSLDFYKNDDILREHVWDEILAYKEEYASLDRLLYVATFKKQVDFLTEGNFDMPAGIE